MIRAILIDDEPKALRSLQNKIQKLEPSIEIIRTTTSPIEGLEIIKELNPDLLFLDIDMPRLSGFDVLSSIESPDFEVIFVTAHSNFAIEAIKHSAIGYVVKPIDNDELSIALKNALSHISQKTSLEKNRQLLQQINGNHNIVIPTQKGLSFFKPEDIVRLEGIDGYTNIFIQNEKPVLSSYNIGKFKKILEVYDFFQVHKSHLINMEYLKSYHNEGTIILSNGDSVPLSRTRKKEFLDIFTNTR
jgi:two-component system LytT family response regulator